MKRNTLTTAVLAGLTGMAGMVSVSNAVNVNPDGLGQVLLYPYYTARGDNATLISIVNTTTRGKAVKIRFIEALNSREVLDFNIYMSPFDVWTAGIVATDEGGGKMLTADTTCTVPYIFGSFDGEQEFLTTELVDGGPDGAERTASGYIEVIEMGTMLETPQNNPGVGSPYYIPWAAKHQDGVPPATGLDFDTGLQDREPCGHLVDQWTNNFPGGNLPWLGAAGPTWGFDTEMGASGGLFGGGSIVNALDGTMFSYNAVALDGFWAPGTTRHTTPDSLEPDLSSGNEFVSNVFVNGQVASHNWFSLTFESSDVAAVNAVLTYNQLLNEYNTEALAGARTEWVMTMPTKRFHTDAAEEGFLDPADDALPPFQDTWTNASPGACESFAFTTPTSFEEYYETDNSRAFDREERPDISTVTIEPPIVSPPPDDNGPEPTFFQLCREANVIRFSSGDPDGENIPGESEILKELWRDGSGLGFSNFELPFDAGWVRFDLTQIPDEVGGGVRISQPGLNLNTQMYEQIEGLPVIGFAANTFVFDEVEAGVRANYGGTFTHRGSRNIVPSDYDGELRD